MKRLMMMGPVASGKTSLIQRMRGEQLRYRKTQAVEFDDAVIDTPGEYMENRQYLSALTVTACDADVIVFVQDAASGERWYSPGQASMFNARVIGVVAKIDLADRRQIESAADALLSAGVERVFEVSNTDGSGIEELLAYIAKLDGGPAGSGKEDENEIRCDTPAL